MHRSPQKQLTRRNDWFDDQGPEALDDTSEGRRLVLAALLKPARQGKRPEGRKGHRRTEDEGGPSAD